MIRLKSVVSLSSSWPTAVIVLFITIYWYELENHASHLVKVARCLTVILDLYSWRDWVSYNVFDAFRENQISWHEFSKQNEYGAGVDPVAI